MTVCVSFDVEVPATPCGVTFAQVIEWLRVELNDKENYGEDNPLCPYEVVPVLGTFKAEVTR